MRKVQSNCRKNYSSSQGQNREMATKRKRYKSKSTARIIRIKNIDYNILFIGQTYKPEKKSSI